MGGPDAPPDRAAMLAAALGPGLRTRREQQQLSVRGLAARLQLSPSAISQIERGKARPSVETLRAIVAELAVSLDGLLGHVPGDDTRDGHVAVRRGGSG